MLIGCHVSIAGGVFNAPQRAGELGCECMQIFSRSPQGGKAPKLTDDVVARYKKTLKISGIEHVYIHTPYFINLASTNNQIRYGSVNVIREELERGSLLGVRYIMTHLGSAGDLAEKAACVKVAQMLKKSLDGYDGSTKLLIENSAGAGKIIGDTFVEIGTIIRAVKNPALAGVCIDTQHAFASGYDFRTPENVQKTFRRIEKELGKNLLKLMHANDSMVAYATHRDRHEHIGKGFIGVESFGEIVRYAKKNKIDMICETEHDFVEKDMSLLKKMRASA